MNINNIEFYLNCSQVQIHSKPSLIPRPFPPPVFDCLQYAKIEREGLGDRVTCLTSGRHEGRCEGGGAQSLQLTNFALISLESTEQWAVLMVSFECYSLKFLDRILQEGPWDSSSGTTPLTSTLTWVWEQPGNKATLNPLKADPIGTTAACPEYEDICNSGTPHYTSGRCSNAHSGYWAYTPPDLSFAVQQQERLVYAYANIMGYWNSPPPRNLKTMMS